ncbi:hypothetical protein H4S06_001219 [Coemansia sp. BCRC 34490]|nr:hypothetical protein H4S06_001219 [Coemansia sp. BCRC 34490]
MCMFLPSLAVFYNVIASTAVIITLYTRQRKVTKALDEASKFTREYLLTPDNNGTNPRAITAKEKGQLEAARRVYRSCIRIALYPLAPVVWWILIATFYIIQYPITLTHYSDANKMVSVLYLTWVAYPAVALINFLVFITDPAVTRVVTQVRKEIRMKLAERRLRAKGSQDTLDYSQDGIAKLPHMALSESYGSGATHGHDGLSVTSGAEKEHLMSHATTDGLGPLEGGESVSTLASGIYNDSVFRRIRADGDVENLMDRL